MMTDTNPPEEITLAQALELAVRLHQDNHFNAAEEVYQAVLKQLPDDPSVLHFYGILRHQRGYSGEGAELIEKALHLSPDYIDAHNNLGNIYLQTGRLDKAETAFRKVIQLNPEFSPAYNNLGVALKELDRYVESIEALLTAIKLEPDNGDYYRNLGNAFRKNGDYEDALSCYRRALAIKPYDAESYRNLSRTFYLLKDFEQAIEVLLQWLEADPDNPIARHMLSSYSGENVPERASDAYVRQTFDRFADSFDAVLQRLDYKAPLLVEQAVRELPGLGDAALILDAGCGTGLCGPLLRPMASRLTGVDLSARMLDKARAREVYDDLVEAELTAFLEQADDGYDVIVSADTLCYFGDLLPFLRAASSALRPGGYLIFTVERLEEAIGKPFHLNRHGRYSHSGSYLAESLPAAGLGVNELREVILRRELDEPVAGFLVRCGSH